MKLSIIDEFRKKSKAFKITAAIAAVVIVVLAVILYKLSPDVPAQRIHFENTLFYLEPGMTLTLNPEYTPYNVKESNIIYHCSDTDVAIMKGATVTALREGEISVYCCDKTNNLKSDTITVRIVESIASLIPGSDASKEAEENEDNTPETKSGAAVYVYCSPSGKKYHTETCTYSGKNPQKVLLAAALEEGLEPCSRCNP